METLLYASAERQIQKAIEICGINRQTENMAVAIIGEDPKQMQNTIDALTRSIGSEPDMSVFEMTKTKETKIKEAFNIINEEIEIVENGNEIKAIVNIVIERVALLATHL